METPPKFLPEQEWGMEKVAFGVKKLQYLWNGQDNDQGHYWVPIGS